ncbi:MAG: hypothetical protein JNL74_05620 [Fibrobacteres bacterium]|nr:hypothetical protein [Fibrobacterota bacterium]
MKKLIITIAFIATAVTAAQDTVRIFWFGHSLLASAGINRSYEFSVWGKQLGIPMVQSLRNTGCSYVYEVKQAWTSTCNADTIRKGNRDFVIYNTGYKVYLPVDTFYKYQALYTKLIDSIGAKAVLYDDWHQPSLNAAKMVCKQNASTYLSPVRSAWLWVSDRYPDIHYSVDGSPQDTGINKIMLAHAAEPLGYLAGCVTWTTVMCRKPFGLDTVYPALDHETAHLMQQVAWNAVVDTGSLPYLPWSSVPPLVNKIDFSPSRDTLEQFKTAQLLIKTYFKNDSSDASSKWAIFRSLDPNIVSVSHSGVVMGLNVGVGRVEALREHAKDTLYVNVVKTSLILDSVRISPKTFTSYLESGFQFAATGYFRDGNVRSALNVTPSINWFSNSDSIFTIIGGKLQRTSGVGGNMFVAVELSGKVDTVKFSMPPQLRFLARINFQKDSIPFNSVWTPDCGFQYTESRGFGWEGLPMQNGKPYFEGETDNDGINFHGANFLTHSYLMPKTLARKDTTGTFHLKCLDGMYIIKTGLGHGNWSGWNNGSQITTVVFNADTLARDSSYTGKPVTTYIDTIRLYGMDGIKLKIKGAIAYIVVCTMEGVNIDSIALDNGEFAVKGTVGSSSSALNAVCKPSIDVCPNPLNPTAVIRINGISRVDGILKIYNTAGKMVAALKPSNGRFVWNGHNRASGLYSVVYSNGRMVLKSRLCLLK